MSHESSNRICGSDILPGEKITASTEGGIFLYERKLFPHKCSVIAPPTNHRLRLRERRIGRDMRLAPARGECRLEFEPGSIRASTAEAPTTP